MRNVIKTRTEEVIKKFTSYEEIRRDHQFLVYGDQIHYIIKFLYMKLKEYKLFGEVFGGTMVTPCPLLNPSRSMGAWMIVKTKII